MFQSLEGNSQNKTKLGSKSISYNEIAIKLLEDKLLLTALELHSELIESGKEIKHLKDFFSNPGNFEFQAPDVPSRLARSGSQNTLDSLDLTRYSEDGGGTDERISILEFELRKAQETINALRNNLTVATESASNTKDEGRTMTVGNIQPHEQRALNFLINEYLLLNRYKLTSITFADENQQQDFDDWDDVGLNIAKPPELLSLYREGLKYVGVNTLNKEVQTDENEKNQVLIEEMETLIKHQKTCIENLKSENTHLKTVNLELQLENNILCEPKISSSPVLETASIHDSNDSNSTERFEIIERNTPMFRKKDFDESISNKSFNANDWLDISTEKGSEDNSECKSKEPNPDIVSQGSYMDEVLAICYINIPKELEAETLDYITNESVTNDTLVHALTTTLLKIIPNIILNKREEVIPLIVSAVLLNPKASERDKLLQQLFNLKKRPTETERLTILTGLMSIAKQSEEKLIENEILPQCWLQLTHKYVERRLLVTEACTMLIPYVSGPIRNSLILSMLQQMIEDKEGTVRERVIKALALLFSLCDDNDKYNQCEKLGLNTLNDSSNSVVSLSVQILFPVLAKWALSAGYLHSSLLKKLLHNLNDDIRSIESQNKNLQTFERIQRMITVIENLLPFLLLSVAVHENVTVNIEKDSSMELRSDFLKICTNLTNPEKVLKPDLNCGMLFYEFDKYIGENPNIFWEKMDWVVDIMLPDLLNNLQHIEVTHQLVLQRFINLFTHIFICFGPNFSKYKVKPLLQKKIQNLEQVINSLNQYCPSLSIIPIYLILLSLSEDFEELSSVLKKFLCDLPLFGAPLDCLEIAVKRLCDMNLQTFVIDCLWTGVVHQRPLVKSATASLFADIIPVCSVDLIKSKIVGAIVTLANDNDVLVRTATIPALGSLVNNCITKEVHDKVYMQLQTYINDNSLKENHTLARQLIVTLGNIVTNCTPMFKNDVILPHLTSLAISTSQMTNQTRKVDMALALLESFTNVVYMSHDDTNVYSVIKPGLKCLETVISENQSLSVHHETALSLLRECDNRLCLVAASSPSMERNVSLSQNVNQGVEEMRQKMNKMFSKPSISKSTTLPNLQGIFKKK